MNYIEAAALTKTFSSNGVTLKTLADRLANAKTSCREVLEELIGAPTYDEFVRLRNVLIQSVSDFGYQKADYLVAEIAKRMTLIGKAKEGHPDAIFLFHTANAYYVYGDDATAAAQVLRLESPQEVCNTPVVTFPLEDIDKHLCKFIRAGKRIAIMGEAD